MQGLGGSLSDEVIDALKVLTRFGLQGVDFSRWVVSARKAGEGEETRYYGMTCTLVQQLSVVCYHALCFA